MLSEHNQGLLIQYFLPNSTEVNVSKLDKEVKLRNI